VSSGCHFVYALAPAGVSASEANDLFNDYVADRSRGLAVWHDHFVGEHGGAVVLDDELRAAEPDDPRYWWRRH
jgi:hypothetical protein